MTLHGEWVYRVTCSCLGTTWRWMVTLKLWPLILLYPFDSNPGGPQSWSVCCEEKKILNPTGTRTLTILAVPPIASRITDWATAAASGQQYMSFLLFLHSTITITRHRTSSAGIDKIFCDASPILSVAKLRCSSAKRVTQSNPEGGQGSGREKSRRRFATVHLILNAKIMPI